MCQIIVRTHKAQEIIHFRQSTNPLKHELIKAAGSFAPKWRHSIRFSASETSRARLLCFASLALRGSVARFACSPERFTLGFFFFLTEHDLWQVYCCCCDDLKCSNSRECLSCSSLQCSRLISLKKSIVSIPLLLDLFRFCSQALSSDFLFIRCGYTRTGLGPYP